MNKNTKIILLVVLSMFAPFIGIPLLIVVLLKDKNQEQQTNTNQQSTIDNDNETSILESQNGHQPIKHVSSSVNSSLPKKQLTILIILCSCALFFMVLGIILTLTIPSGIGKTILQATGFIEIFGAIIGIILMYRKMYYTCPECGTKREHHRQFIETTSRQLTQTERNTSLTKRTVIYKHVYLDTYVCPKCGETMENRATSEGGKIVYDYRGIIVYDNTKPPKEF